MFSFPCGYKYFKFYSSFVLMKFRPIYCHSILLDLLQFEFATQHTIMFMSDVHRQTIK